MKYYCTHHTPATDRKQYITENFIKTYNLNVIWIEDYLPTDIRITEHFRVFCKHAANGSFLNNAELSLFYKHKLAIELINNSQEFGVIIEDDIAKPDFDLVSFVTTFTKAMQDNNIELLFIGSFGQCDIMSKKPILLCNEYTLSRCAHAYIVNPKICNKLLKHLDNVVAPIDWQLNYAIEELNLKSCWSYPHIYQRTEKHQIPSLIRI